MTFPRAHRGVAASFFFLVTASLAGCNISQEIRNIIGAILVGNGGDGCVAGCVEDCGGCDCTSCDCDCACDCAGCDGCEILPIPGGFAGAHPGARIANAAQVRVTDGALDFVGGQIPTLIGAVPDVPLPYFPLDINNDGMPEGTIRLELRNTDVLTPTTTQCNGNYANSLGTNQACVRARLDVNYRTCAYSPDPVQQATNCNDGADSLTITQTVPVIGTVTCNVTLNSEGIIADAHDNLPIEADIAIVNESVGPYAGYSRFVILDAEVVTNAALEPQDVAVDCGASEGTINTFIQAASPIDCIEGRQFDCGSAQGCAPFTNNQTCRECNFGVVSGQNCIGLGGGWGACEAPCDLDQAVWITLRDFAAEDDDDASMGNELGAEVADDVDDLIDDILDDLLQDPETLIDDGQLCKIATEASDCPAGTTFMDGDSGDAETQRGICAINGTGDPVDNDPPPRCLGPLLGLEGRVNLGGLLASISPGINAVVDFLFAAGGPGVTAGNGYNVNLFGGLENLSHDNCVPQLAPGDPGHVVNPMGTIPQVSVFQNSTRPSGTPFDVGLAVSEEFVNYALYRVWDAGMLCLTVTSSLSGQLSPETLSPLLFASSVNRFLFPLSTGGSYLGLAIRPQQPPIVTTETIADPTEPADDLMAVTISLPALELDFLFWTQDRYTRLTTIRTDLDVTLTLDVVANGANDELALKIGSIAFSNASFRNASTLMTTAELESDVASTLNSVAPLIAGGLAGSIPPIALEELVNSALVLPDAGGGPGTPLPLRIDFGADSFLPFEETGGHPFIGVFLDLVSPPVGGGLVMRAETTVEVTSLTMPEDRSAFAVETLGEGALPRLEIAMDAQGPSGVEYEYSYRTTFTGWSAWSRSKYAIIEDASLVLQQHQKVFARARVVGADQSTDYSSATADFTIDVTEPVIQVTSTPSGEGTLEAYDYVYGTDLEYRVDGGAWRAIAPGSTSLGPITDATVVEVRDGSGNVSANNKLRGRGDPDAAVGGCGCATAGTSEPASTPAFSLSLVVLALALGRRRLRNMRR